ncbi:uncharacterized protein LOC142365360 [Opisthocomus hoazin]|uniref:uncharacterized protein LOC142365349 n=1 Tax=Opisthocomus hoazin TaxID=30419 RepID=UPI003F532ABF
MGTAEEESVGAAAALRSLSLRRSHLEPILRAGEPVTTLGRTCPSSAPSSRLRSVAAKAKLLQQCLLGGSATGEPVCGGLGPVCATQRSDLGVMCRQGEGRSVWRAGMAAIPEPGLLSAPVSRPAAVTATSMAPGPASGTELVPRTVCCGSARAVPLPADAQGRSRRGLIQHGGQGGSGAGAVEDTALPGGSCAGARAPGQSWGVVRTLPPCTRFCSQRGNRGWGATKPYRFLLTCRVGRSCQAKIKNFP